MRILCCLILLLSRAWAQFPHYCQNVTVDPDPNLFPKGWDWREHNAVTPIKGQRDCGSSWAFSTVACMETAWARAGHPLTAFSEEELVQCDTKGPDNGCNGGYLQTAFEYVLKSGGINTEEAYPYTSSMGIRGTCNTTLAKHKVGRFSHCVQLPSDEPQMATWLKHNGAIAIAISEMALISPPPYNGVIPANECSQRGPGLRAGALVGFTVLNNHKFWIAKLSLGVGLGNRGYFYIPFGVNCLGVALHPTSILA